ncbi:MAG: DUF1576 domain-containing protein [Paraclostridium sp.]
MYICKFEERDLHKEHKLRILAVFPSIFLIIGLFLAITQAETSLITGFKNILVSPTILITDFLVVGGISATYFNVAIIGFYNIYLLKRLKLRPNGLIIAAFMTVLGFSFFGKNVFNILPIYLGGYLYSLRQDIEFKDVIVSIMFATALAPVISEISFANELRNDLSIPIGVAIGTFVGFVITPIAAHMVKFYDGYNIYNIGFTAGIIGTILTSTLRSLDLEVEPVNILYLENNFIILVTLTIMFVYLIGIGIYINKDAIKQYKNVFKYSGRVVTDYTYLVGYGVTFFNMGIMGLICLIYVVCIGGVVNGPVIAGIFTVVGFSAFGKHLKNCTPIVIGVILMALILNKDITSTSVIITVLFSTTLAPLAGVYGFNVGIMAGMLHFILASNVGIIHGGVNLYNNGFAGGLVAGFLLPMIDAFRRGRD